MAVSIPGMLHLMPVLQNWHLPSEEEWVISGTYLEITEEDVKIIQYRGDGEGTKLKSETEWEVNNGENHGRIILPDLMLYQVVFDYLPIVHSQI